MTSLRPRPPAPRKTPCIEDGEQPNGLTTVEAEDFDAERLDEAEAEEPEIEADEAAEAKGAGAEEDREADLEEALRRHFGILEEQPDEELTRDERRELRELEPGEFICQSCFMQWCLACDEATKKIRVLGEMAVADELLDRTQAGGAAQPGCQTDVVEQPVDRGSERAEVRGVVNEQALVLVADLVLDAADARSHERFGLDHGFGDGEPEPLLETLLHHHRGMALEGVDHRRVLIGIVHRERDQVDSGPHRAGHPVIERTHSARTAVPSGSSATPWTLGPTSARWTGGANGPTPGVRRSCP
jgi:hypothetical protein